MSNRKINDEIQKLKDVVSSSTNTNNELKNDLKLYRNKSNFLEQFWNKLEAEYNENREKQLAAV